MTVQESSFVTQRDATNDVRLADFVHGCEWYSNDNVDHIPLNGKVPKEKWGLRKNSFFLTIK